MACVVEHAQTEGKLDNLQKIQAGLNSGKLGWDLFCVEVGKLMGVSPTVVADEYRKIPLNTELVEAIQNYKSTYTIGLLSNADRSQLEPQLKSRNLEDLFDFIGISSDYGLMKPAPELFTKFVTSMSLLPGQCIMIDDNPDNIAGAKKAGLVGIQFTNNAQLFSDLGVYL